MAKFWGSGLLAAGLVLFATASFADNSCDTDFNDDGITDAADVEVLRAALGANAGDENYNAQADINGDGLVSTLDYGLMLECS
jgi:hypothetical protein